MGVAEGANVIRIDMHLHTALSFDCRSAPDAVLERALASGLDRICVTDHNEIQAALELKERHPDRVIVGEEVKTREKVDIIGLYVDEWIPPGTPARAVCEEIHRQGGLVYVPHPFAGGKGSGTLLPHIEDLVDVVEGWNARVHSPDLNRRAQAWARARQLPMGAGSDAHSLREVGRAWVQVSLFDDEPAAFLAALQTGTIHGGTSSRLVHLTSTLAKLLP